MLLSLWLPARASAERASAERALPRSTAPEPSTAAPLADGDPAGRMRVRGDRPERASIHAAWSPPAYEPDADDRAALASFEAARDQAATIVEVAPEAWMKALTLPDLPVRWNRGLVDYLEYFTRDDRGRTMMRAWLRRAGRYEARLRKILRAHAVPEDLVWVVMAESGFNPRVRSAVGAAGPWQFMEGTGGVYGLDKSFWIDERFDIERSSHAAATYLEDLRVRFGSWELALAAYNAGYGLVMTAIERHNTNNFWALAEIESGLPHATVNYVPKIVAAAIVARNREHFGFGPDAVEPLPAAEWAEIEVSRSVTLASIAKALGVELELLQEWNAQLVRGRTPPSSALRGQGLRATTLRIPKDKLASVPKALAQVEREHEGERTIVAREGERLETIARAHGLSEKELRKRNGILDAAEVTAGVVLVVPQTAAMTDDERNAARPLAAVPAVTTGPDQRLVFFEVTRASSPRSIAQAFATRWERVVQWNDLDPLARLQPGQLLQLVVPKDFDAHARGVVVLERDQVEHVTRGSREHIEAELARRGKLRRAVKARKGDTLESLGRRHGLSSGDLARINGYPRDHALATGELVVVYVDEDGRRGTLEAPPPRGAEPPSQSEREGTEAEQPTTRAARGENDTRATDDAAPARRRERGRRTKRHSPSTPQTSRVPGRDDER